MRRTLVIPLVLTLIVPGCASMGAKEQAGTVIGGASGALLGAQVGSGRGRLLGVAVGTLAGALIGQEIGKSLDAADRQAMEASAQRALEYNRTGEPETWRNPDSGHHGSTIPQRTYKTAQGRYCREYQQTVIIGGEEHQAYGTACRQPDGSWEIVK